MRGQKLHKRRIDALKAGHLRDDEVDEELVNAAIECVAKDRVAQRGARADTRRKLQIVQKESRDFQGKTIYSTSPIDPVDGALVADCLPADFIVCDEPGSPPLALRFAACLHGSSICTRGFLHSTGGVCASYARAVAVKRHIHLTDGFVNAHVELAELLLKYMPLHWDLASVEQLTRIVGGKASNQRLVFVFMAEGEGANEDIVGFTNKLTATSCFDCALFCKVNKSKSWVGACTL